MLSTSSPYHARFLSADRGRAGLAKAACLGTALVALTATALTVTAARAADASQFLYVESNSPVAGQNSVIGYRRGSDGSLSLLPGSPFLTGGTGLYDLTGGAIFDADNVMAYGHGVIYVPNGGSNTIAGLRVQSSGRLTPIPGSPFATAGDTPNALGLSGNTLVVVSNAGNPVQATANPVSSYNTGRLTPDGQYIENKSAEVTLAAVNPTEAVAVPWTSYVITVEMAGGTISSRYIDRSHALHLVQSAKAPMEGTTQPVQLGAAVNPAAPYVYVGLPNVAQLGTYKLGATGELTFVGTAANSGKAICWVQVAADGKHLYSTNPGDHSVSEYDLSNPAEPVEVAHVVLADVAGALFQFKISPDGRFMYALESESSAAAVGLSNKIHVLALAPVSGTPSEIASSPVKLPLPGGMRAQGVLVF